MRFDCSRSYTCPVTRSITLRSLFTRESSRQRSFGRFVPFGITHLHVTSQKKKCKLVIGESERIGILTPNKFYVRGAREAGVPRASAFVCRLRPAHSQFIHTRRHSVLSRVRLYYYLVPRRVRACRNCSRERARPWRRTFVGSEGEGRGHLFSRD